jgi:3-hydroxyisobutyrate dehydrogenase
MTEHIKKRVALFGLGIMGTGMANRLLTAGFPLTVYNRSEDKTITISAAGAVVAKTPAEAASRAEILISMVADDAASRNLWFGPDGALKAAAPNSILIESSTLTVGWVKELAVAASASGCALLDAPVTGSKAQAAGGLLGFLVGGDAQILQKAAPVLEVLGRIIHMGPTGSGALMKIVNNFLSGVQAASLAEAIALIERGGLDREKALEIILNGAPGSPMLRTLTGRIVANDYTPNFLLRLMAKDLSYVIQEGEKRSLELRTAVGALEVFNRAIQAGHGEKDMAAAVEQFRKTEAAA